MPEPDPIWQGLVTVPVTAYPAESFVQSEWPVGVAPKEVLDELLDDED